MKNKKMSEFDKKIFFINIDCWNFGDIKILRDSWRTLIPEKYEIFHKEIYKGEIKLLFEDNEYYINFILEEEWNGHKNIAFTTVEHAVLFLKEKQIEYLQEELKSKEK